MKELTRQQQAVYDFVKSYIEKKSYPPTIREIGAAVGLSSTSTVHSHVKTLIIIRSQVRRHWCAGADRTGSW